MSAVYFRTVYYYFSNLECAPSQKAPLAECLHPHQATFLSSVISTRSGTKPVPLCEPSQNGCLVT